MHIVDFDDALDYRQGTSARARARASASQRRSRRAQSNRRARDARQAGMGRGNSLPFARGALARNVSTRSGTRYPQEWDIEDSQDFSDYGPYGYEAPRSARGQARKTSRAYRAYEEPADFEEYYDDEEVYEEEEPIQESWIKRFQRRNRKRRAERIANRAFEGESSRQGEVEQERSRAAVYEMKMGSKHRSMVRTQSTSARSRAALRRLSLPSLPTSSVVLRVLGGALVCVIAAGVFLYPAAKDYYVAVREHDKAAIAVQVAQERNTILAQDVEALSTPEGIEDRARSEYGWVKEGENAVTVTGLAQNDDGIKRLEDLPTVEGVQAPETWYSPVLDQFFGYAR